MGLYGACSTMGEGLSLAAMMVAAGYGENDNSHGVKSFWKRRETI